VLYRPYPGSGSVRTNAQLIHGLVEFCLTHHINVLLIDGLAYSY
jgi:hypothetical protein